MLIILYEIIEYIQMRAKLFTIILCNQKSKNIKIYKVIYENAKKITLKGDDKINKNALKGDDK